MIRQLSLDHKQQFALFALLGFYAAYILVFTDVSGQPVGYIFKGQSVFLDSLTFQMGPRGCPEMPGINHQSTLRKFPEERISHTKGGSLKNHPAPFPGTIWMPSNPLPLRYYGHFGHWSSSHFFSDHKSVLLRTGKYANVTSRRSPNL